MINGLYKLDIDEAKLTYFDEPFIPQDDRTLEELGIHHKGIIKIMAWEKKVYGPLNRTPFSLNKPYIFMSKLLLIYHCRKGKGSVEFIKTKEITSLHIHNLSAGPGFEVMDQIYKHRLIIYRSGKVKQYVYKIYPNGTDIFEYKMDPAEMELFFDFLINTVKINEWADDYSVPGLDGWRWECIITYSDRTIKRIQGTVEPPPNGDLLKKRINQLVKYQVKPWIF